MKWPVRYTLLLLSFAAYFVCYIDRVNISVAAIAMQEQFGWSETLKGLVLSAFFAGYLLFQLPGGYLANRFGGKRVLGASVLWWSVCTMLTPIAAATLPLLFTARVAIGLGEGVAFSALYEMFSRWAPRVERSRWIAILLSGVPLGTLFALSVSGGIIARWGWPAVFYCFGGVGFIWAGFWFVKVYADPAQHPDISAAERALIEGDRVQTTVNQAIPWRRLLSIPAVWALAVNHFCSNWGLYMLLSWLPSYFRKIQHLSIADAGFYSAAPWLSMLVMINVAGWIADAMIRRKVSITTVRKLMQITGLLGSGLFLLLARDVADSTSALLMMCGALGTLAFTWAGFAPNHLDIAPRYAGVLAGFSNTAGTIPGVIGVAVTGALVQSSGNYASAFLLTAGINLLGALVWLAFATGERVLE
jgi:MFS transporter, ACS family, solute carrier family 17 (sodium-dependent inorganic phosphate cotransporter), other